MSASKTVLFVCTGNTCRSPMAEGLLKAALKSKSMSGVTVLSAGVAAMDGDAASIETLDVLADRGAEIDGFRSRSMTSELMAQTDLVIPMTSSHADVLTHYFPDQSEKVTLLCDFIESSAGMAGMDVADPIGMGGVAYEEVADTMTMAMPGIIEALQSEGRVSK